MKPMCSCCDARPAAWPNSTCLFCESVGYAHALIASGRRMVEQGQENLRLLQAEEAREQARRPKQETTP